MAIGFDHKVTINLIKLRCLVSFAREKLTKVLDFELVNFFEGKPFCWTVRKLCLSFDFALKLFFLLKVEVRFGQFLNLIDDFS